MFLSKTPESSPNAKRDRRPEFMTENLSKTVQEMRLAVSRG